MGCRTSSPVMAYSYLGPMRSIGGALSRNGKEPSDICVLGFYPEIRSAYIEFLRERQMDSALLLYEALNQLFSADSSLARTLVDQMRSTVLSKEGIHRVGLSKRSKDKLLFLSAMNFTNFHQGKLLGKIIDELEGILAPLTKDFRNSPRFYECMKPNPSVRSILAGKRDQMLMAVPNDFAATIVSKMMKERNFNIQHVRDGTSALAELMSNQYDVALICLDLPDKSGINIVQDVVRLEDLCRKKIMNYVRPRFLGMTSWGLDSKRNSAIRAGYDEVLRFPFSASDFEAVMKIDHRKGSHTASANIS